MFIPITPTTGGKNMGKPLEDHFTKWLPLGMPSKYCSIQILFRWCQQSRTVPDIVDRATRSRMMSAIRGTNTLPERTVRKYLHAAGLRFRLHARDLPARPDIVFG